MISLYFILFILFLINPSLPSQYKYKYCIKPTTLLDHITHITDVLGYGNCGFRSAAISLDRNSDDWVQVRQKIISELDSNPLFKDHNFMENFFGLTQQQARRRLENLSGPAPSSFWITFPGHGFLLAETYKRLVVLFSKMPATYLPLMILIILPSALCSWNQGIIYVPSNSRATYCQPLN